MSDTGRRGKGLGIGRRARRLTTVVHIITAGTWFGLDAAFAVLAYTAIFSNDVETAGEPHPRAPGTGNRA